MELLLRRAGHHIVGTADDAEAGEALILRRKPDVALVDLALPGKSGAEMTRSLLAEEPQLRIILYTGAADERQLLDALDAGAAGIRPQERRPGGARAGDPNGRGGRRLPRSATDAAARGEGERAGQDAVSARARDHGPALAGTVRRGGREAALPLLRDGPDARAQRHVEARRGHPRARRRAGAPARRDLSPSGCLGRSSDRHDVRSAPAQVWIASVDNSFQTDKGKPVARRGRKARGLSRDGRGGSATGSTSTGGTNPVWLSTRSSFGSGLR